MPSYENNAYYHPESFDPPLRLVCSIDNGDYYDFDTFLVVQVVGDNRVFVAHDSGCSCPTPFEDHNNLADDFTEVKTFADVRREYDKVTSGAYRSWPALSVWSAKIVEAFRRGA